MGAEFAANILNFVFLTAFVQDMTGYLKDVILKNEKKKNKNMIYLSRRNIRIC